MAYGLDPGLCVHRAGGSINSATLAPSLLSLYVIHFKHVWVAEFPLQMELCQQNDGELSIF